MCATDFGSTLMIVAPLPRAAWPRGRTTRPWSIPGTRTFWTYVVVAATIDGMSSRGTLVPMILKLDVGVSVAFAAAIVELKSLPDIRSLYLSVLPPPETTPSAVVRLVAGTPS